MTPSTAQVTVYRYDPQCDAEPSAGVYEIDVDDEITVLQALSQIYERCDPSLAYRRCNCYRGVCGECLVSVDGRNRRACSVVVRPGDAVVVRPAKGYPVIRDLVVDQSSGDRE